MFGERSSDAARASFSSRARLSGIRLQATAGRNFSATGRPRRSVFGAIDLAHSACPKAFADAVVLNCCADHVSAMRRPVWKRRPNIQCPV